METSTSSNFFTFR